MPLDLSKFDVQKPANEGAVLRLCDPVSGVELTSDGKPLEITLLGKDSQVFRKISRMATNKRLDRQQRNGRVKLTSEEIEADSMQLIVACTVSWANIVVDDKPLECTPANVTEFYTRFPWAFEQADQFVGARENFMKAS